jgi:hypothetical protein
MYFLLVVLFLMGTHSAFFGPAKYSILPDHLPKQGSWQAMPDRGRHLHSPS